MDPQYKGESELFRDNSPLVIEVTDEFITLSQIPIHEENPMMRQMDKMMKLCEG
ncbi:MAG: hypothetical protein MI863_21345 [Desulfobacterales bacterium]|nr:hypothetical protein [Desulfobacterales bacterium]